MQKGSIKQHFKGDFLKILMESIFTDVLVIGGGGAGSRAALSSKMSNPELDITIATTGVYGFSGSTNFIASETLGINAPLDNENDGDNPEIYKHDIIETGLGLADRELCEIISLEAEVRVLDLLKLGVKFDSSSEGVLKQKKLSGCTKARSLSVEGKTGVEIIKALKAENIRKGVNIIENCKLLELLVDENEVKGGVFLYNRKPVLIVANAVIMTTGGAGRIFSNNVNPPDINGTGYAAALKAGVELTNIEFIQIGPGVVWPERKFIIHSYMWAFLPVLTNNNNEEFLSKYLPDGLDYRDVLNEKMFSFPFSCRTDSKYLDIAIFKEIEKGNSTRRNGIYLDVSHISVKELKEKAHVTYEFFNEIGFDISKQKLEIAPMVQSFNGGIIINKNAETNISGLYAAGEASGGIHGADRPGGNNLIDCQVFGHRAGCSAAERVVRIKRTKIVNRDKCPISLITDEIEKQIGDIGNINKKSYENISKNLRNLFAMKLSVVRNKDGLNQVIETTQRIISDSVLGKINKVSDLYCAALTGNAIAAAALAREESRGTHYREDFPLLSLDFTKRINVFFENNRIRIK